MEGIKRTIEPHLHHRSLLYHHIKTKIGHLRREDSVRLAIEIVNGSVEKFDLSPRRRVVDDPEADSCTE